jgi:hypothetical protein
MNEEIRYIDFFRYSIYCFLAALIFYLVKDYLFKKGVINETGKMEDARFIVVYGMAIFIVSGVLFAFTGFYFFVK